MADEPGKRKSLKKILVGGGVVTTVAAKWSKPVVDGVILPAHAQATTPAPTPAPMLTPAPTPTPTPTPAPAP